MLQYGEMRRRKGKGFSNMGHFDIDRSYNVIMAYLIILTLKGNRICLRAGQEYPPIVLGTYHYPIDGTFQSRPRVRGDK
jgi:hypothetical protein